MSVGNEPKSTEHSDRKIISPGLYSESHQTIKSSHHLKLSPLELKKKIQKASVRKWSGDTKPKSSKARFEFLKTVKNLYGFGFWDN